MEVSVKAGFLAAWPLVLGYFPVAVAFGLLGREADLSPWEIQMVSLLVFAGASQFALVGLVAQGTPPLLAAGLGLLLNLRHAFYGPALRPYLRGGPLEAFLLTDEVFALALKTLPHLPEEERRAHFLGLGLGAYLSWNLGTLLGSLGAEGLKGLSQAFGFALPALFFLLALPHLRNRVALLAGGVALVLHLLGQTALGLVLAGALGLLGRRP
jgi:predicted branched-subunit amino acid permease